MSSPTVPTRLTLRIPGGMMPTPSRPGVRSRLAIWQGIPDREALAGNKENSPVASLGGGDAVCQRRAAAPQHQALMSPEIPGLKMPKRVKDVFYGK
jgi:hypothetical protein